MPSWSTPSASPGKPMKLEFLYTPVKDLKAALALYRDTLG
jgi:hypothetical protein